MRLGDHDKMRRRRGVQSLAITGKKALMVKVCEQIEEISRHDNITFETLRISRSHCKNMVDLY